MRSPLPEGTTEHHVVEISRGTRSSPALQLQHSNRRLGTNAADNSVLDGSRYIMKSCQMREDEHCSQNILGGELYVGFSPPNCREPGIAGIFTLAVKLGVTPSGRV